MQAHSETDFIPVIFVFLQRHQSASFAQLRRHIQANFPLNRADWEQLPSLGCPVWHQRVRNLKSNKTLLSNYQGIMEIRGGFALSNG